MERSLKERKRQIKSGIYCTVFFIFVICFSSLNALAAVPQTINYQGVIRDSAGNPVSGTTSVTFKIYTVSTGGAALWSETQVLNVANGIFTSLLGSVTSFPSDLFTNSSLFLGVTVESDIEMTPRQQIVSTPFAQVAGNAPIITYTDTFNDDRLSPADTWGTYSQRQLNFTKISDSSLLRISYQDTLGYLGSTYQGCLWRVQIDGVTKLQFSAADTDTYGTGNLWHMENATHTALVPNIASGNHTVTVDVYLYSSRATQCLAGWNSTGEYMSVEEIFNWQ